MEEILLHNSFILFEIICVIAVFALFIIRSHFFTEILDHNARLFTKILFMVFFGLLSIVGTVTGVGLFGSIGNVRDIGPMMAGLTCGPIIGLGAGLIGGVFRFMQGGPYMYTGLSAPILCGIMGGLLYIANKREFVPTWMATLYMALCDTLISIYTLTLVTPPDQLWIITKNIAVPMIVGSTIGVFIFSFFIHAQISERNKEKEIKRLERENADRKNLDSIINTLADPVFVMDKSYCWKLVNDKFCSFFGKLRNEIVGKHIEEFLPAPDYHLIREQADEVFKTGNSPESEFAITGSHGQRHTVIMKNSLLVDSNGENFVVGIIRDISDRKKMEETIKESEAQLSSILHGSPVMQFVIDKNHKVLFWNHALEKFSGFAAHTIIGTSDYWKAFYQRYHPMLADLLVDGSTDKIPQWYSDKVKKAQYVEGAYEGIEYMPGPQTGSSGKWFSFSAAPVHDTKGGIIGAVETLQDVTENKQLEASLQLSLKKLNLLSSITRHDLMNKLSVVWGFGILLSEYIKDTEGQDILDKLKITIESIQNQLIFTREYQELGIKNPIWQNAAEVIQSAIHESGVSFISCEDELSQIEIYADPLLIKVFYNLFENAKRYGETINQIKVSSTVSDNELIITVADDGIGIPDDEKEIIFERGYGKNTGFGLFLSREILAITGIFVKETGIPGSGASFEIQIPKSGFKILKKDTIGSSIETIIEV